MKTLTIIDTFGFLFRSYFALPRLQNSQGFPTGLLTGFAKTIMQLHRDYPNDYLIFAVDSKENLRKKIDPTYKANRQEAPENLKIQLEIALQWVEEMGVKSISIDGYEADDVIASLNKYATEQGIKVRIISHDKDLYQLINQNTLLFDPIKKIEVKHEECKEKYGVYPEQFIDYQSIVGDTADNVPGVKGIGAKGAAALLEEFGSLDNIYANLDKIKTERIRKLLEVSKSDAYKSKELVRLNDSLIKNLDLQSCLMPKICPLNNIIPSLVKYDLNSILKKLSNTKEIKQNMQEKRQDSNFSYKWNLLNTNEALMEFAKNLDENQIIAFDTETTSLDVKTAKIVGFSFSLDGVDSYYVPIAHSYLGVEEQVSLECAKEFIKKIFSCKEIIGHNIKYDIEILKTNFNIYPDFSKIRDSMILAWLYKSDSLSNLDFLMKKYFSHEMIAYKDIVKKDENFSSVLISHAAQYASEDAAASYCLYFKLKDLLEQELNNIAIEVEFPFIENLVNMELGGIRVDVEYLNTIKQETKQRLNDISEEIFDMTQKRFNLNSPQQLADVLFNDLQLQTGKKTKSGFSTSENVLKSLYDTHPIIQKILEYRELFKLYSTYIEPLISYAQNDKEHRIYTSFMQTGTNTGRLSSKNPNLQNIPTTNVQGKNIRQAFIAKENHTLLSLDYSQIELRLLAHFSEDKAMMDAFFNDLDIHLETAKKIFGNEMAKEYRSIAKSINFGLIYGMGPKKLSETLKIDYKQAKEYIQNYFLSFPSVKGFLKLQEEFILKNSYSKTILGRKRSFDFKDIQEHQKATFLREGINAIFQGSAADIIKIAMNKITQQKLQSKMLLQVHDELIFESPKEAVEEESKIIAEIMENALQLKIPLKCSINIGDNWSKLK